MKIYLYRDSTVEIDLPTLCQCLNELSNGVEFHAGRKVVHIPDAGISLATYKKLKLPMDNMRLRGRDLALVATKIPYANNYFYDFPGKTGIISFDGWERLTTLPIVNGFVYFATQLLADSIPTGESHDKNTGCLNDFMWDKAGVDIGMRSAFICPRCKQDFDSKTRTADEVNIFKTAEVFLDQICLASRNGQSLLDYWKANPKTENDFDVFLCHNSQDKDTVRELNTQLQNQGVNTWFDEEQLQPGLPWQEELEKQISSIKSAVIAVGGSGSGPWQNVELKAFINEFVRRGCPVIPLLLQDCKEIPELPLFLRQFMWVDLRKTRPDPLKQLVWGITGRRQ